MDEEKRVLKSDVVFACMPFWDVFAPSIGLSILKSVLNEQGNSSEILYFTLDFAKIIDPRWHTFIGLNTSNVDQVGEWIFSGALFEQSDEDARRYVDDILQGGNSLHRPMHDKKASYNKQIVERLLEIRSRVPDFLDQCVEGVLKRNPRIVGFTSTFQQHIPSLALAKRLKLIDPSLYIVFGGANCESVMGAELVKQFPFVDAVVSGEGETSFPNLVDKVLEGKDIEDIEVNGVFTRRNIQHGMPLVSASSISMDEIPVPDYADFFEQFKNLFPDKIKECNVPFETSRGCWWGQKSHCTFCGLNGDTMAFRSKSQGRAIEELLHISSAYPAKKIFVVDNILDMKYFKEFVPRLAELDKQLNLFYEVKANLRKEQVRQLSEAGIREIQPGIESLNDHVLQLMRKGVTGLQNIQLLKWCLEYDVFASWNILWGFPGETSDDYTKFAEIIPLLTHLYPPSVATTIRLDRFSPNFEQADSFGFRDVKPYPVLEYLYPFAEDVLQNLSYFFVSKSSVDADVERYTFPVYKVVEEWKQVHEESALFYVDKTSQLLIIDFRPIAITPLTILSGFERSLYLECDTATSYKRLEAFASTYVSEFPNGSSVDLDASLERLIIAKLILKQESQYLSLAVPLGIFQPNQKVLKRLSQVFSSTSITGQQEPNHEIGLSNDFSGKNLSTRE